VSTVGFENKGRGGFKDLEETTISGALSSEWPSNPSPLALLNGVPAIDDNYLPGNVGSFGRAEEDD
jgi:hypothetical protein